jgi:hypothetical protein
MSAPGYPSMASIGCRSGSASRPMFDAGSSESRQDRVEQREVEKYMASIARFRRKLLVAARGRASKYIYRGRVGCDIHQIP